MESDEIEQSFDISIMDLQNAEKKENTKKSLKKYAREYVKRTEVKDRLTAKRESAAVNKRLREMDVDQHIICKKLGKTIAFSRRHPEYRFKCTRCEVSYSKKDQGHFFKKFHCPCCHLKLRQRKTIAQKRNTAYENFSKKVSPDQNTEMKNGK